MDVFTGAQDKARPLLVSELEMFVFEISFKMESLHTRVITRLACLIGILGQGRVWFIADMSSG